VYAVTELLPQLIKDLNRLQPEYSSADRIWRLPICTGAKPKDWAMMHARRYKETYYLSWTLNDFSPEFDSRGVARTPAVENLAGAEMGKLAYALKQVRRIEEDWVSVYRETARRYPLEQGSQRCGRPTWTPPGAFARLSMSRHRSRTHSNDSGVPANNRSSIIFA
jgi:hypothetical protein